MKTSHIKSKTSNLGYVLLTAGCLLQLAGCSTLTTEECINGNWQAIGFADGAAGREATYLKNHNKACSKVGVVANYSLWEQGRQQGLKQYCTETNAYQIGRRGTQMTPVCPAEITPKLERINADGRKFYSLNKQLTIEQDRLETYREQYNKLRNGSNLNFSSEIEARKYLSELPDKATEVNRRIHNLQLAIAEVQTKYGY